MLKLKRTSTKSILARITAIMIVMTATTVWAVISDIVVVPSEVMLGTAYTCYPDDAKNSDLVQTPYKWELVRVYPKSTLPKTVVGTDRELPRYAEVPATNKFTLTVTYRKAGMGAPPPPGPTYPKKDVVIVQPDSAGLLSGYNTPVPNQGSIQLIYHPRLGQTKYCGPYLNGQPQEMLTNQIIFPGHAVADIPWQPAVPTDTFRLSLGKIHDEHAEWIAPANWSAIPVGDVIRSFTQHLKIVYGDPDGNTYDIPLGQIGIRHRKISATHWRIEYF